MGISWIIPAYNEEGYVGTCIDSIRKEMVEFSEPYEILVVDNNSASFSTALEAINCGATVLWEPLKGVTHARSLGFAKAKYELIACIDADNTIPRGWVFHAMRAINFSPETVAVYGPVFYKNMPYLFYLWYTVFYAIAWMAKFVSPFIQGGNFVVRKTAIEQTGGYTEFVPFWGEDTFLGRNLSKAGRVRFCFNMWVYSSPRRLQKQGVINTAWKYASNYIWISLTGHPFDTEYEDYR
jgi:glycosyltransferase involved in cell wall biosynthesis